MRWPREEDFDAIINTVAPRYNVPGALVRAIIATETGGSFNPASYRPEPDKGVANDSAGLMQILYDTAKGQGYTGPFGDRSKLTGLFDPATNIEYGTSYLAHQLQLAGGDIAGAASAYNGGWRPSIGFGQKADHAMSIILARDPQGNVTKRRQVQPGEFSNQPYVDSVLANYAYFRSKEAASAGVTQLNPLTPTGTTNPKLVGILVGLLVALVLKRARRK